jgi:hypothetical protein
MTDTISIPIPRVSQPSETRGKEERNDAPRRERRDRRIRKLFESGLHASWLCVNEQMGVLELNRNRPGGHPGQAFVARDIKLLRDIQRSRTERSIRADSSIS